MPTEVKPNRVFRPCHFQMRLETRNEVFIGGFLIPEHPEFYPICRILSSEVVFDSGYIFEAPIQRRIIVCVDPCEEGVDVALFRCCSESGRKYCFHGKICRVCKLFGFVYYPIRSIFNAIVSLHQSTSVSKYSMARVLTLRVLAPIFFCTSCSILNRSVATINLR